MRKHNSDILLFATIFGVLAVVIGAFGAHGLKPRLTEYQVAIFEKGVQYQFYHTLAIGIVGLLIGQQPDLSTQLRWAARCFIFGIICFSGSLYLLACRDILPFSVAWAGPVTPLGGLGFIAGWGIMGWAVYRRAI
jgi:uncharacterized membrane protein YgdD (TMEM256/DUF423 family)